MKTERNRQRGTDRGEQIEGQRGSDMGKRQRGETEGIEEREGERQRGEN